VYPIVEYELQYRLCSPNDDTAAAVGDAAGWATPLLDAQSMARAVQYCAHVVEPLRPNQHYTFRLRAANTTGWGPWGAASVPIRTRASKADAPPGSPTLVATSVATPLPAGPASLLLTWDAPACLGGCAVCGFDVQWAEVPNVEHELQWQARRPPRASKCLPRCGRMHAFVLSGVLGKRAFFDLRIWGRSPAAAPHCVGLARAAIKAAIVHRLSL
jgi:hypothetical protein